MQAKTYLHGAVRLSEAHRGKRRSTPVWELRYRLPSGKDSRKVLGRAWVKASLAGARIHHEGLRPRAPLRRSWIATPTTCPPRCRTFGLACDDFLRLL